MTDLSPRQQQVAALVAEGLSNKAIARKLELSYGTVRQYVVRIAKKLPGDGPPRWRIMAWHFRRSESDRAA